MEVGKSTGNDYHHGHVSLDRSALPDFFNGQWGSGLILRACSDVGRSAIAGSAFVSLTQSS